MFYFEDLHVHIYDVSVYLSSSFLGSFKTM